MAEDNGFRTVNTMIQARNLTKRYGTISAVDGLSFEALAGHVTGFLGPNGSGKSTTMRAHRRRHLGLRRSRPRSLAVVRRRNNVHPRLAYL